MVLEQERGMVWARQMANDMEGFQFMTNSTSSVINDLKFAVAKQVRSMIIILSGFNVAMALVLAIVIFRNCYKGQKQNDPTFRLRYDSSLSCYRRRVVFSANIELVLLFFTSSTSQKYSHSSYPLA
jgi:choline-glycine betaine transporter